MERTRFKFSAKTPCLVFCDKVFLGEIDKNVCAKLEILEGQTKYIEVFPKSTKDVTYFIPFAFELSSNTRSSSNYIIYDLLDANYEIEINPRLELHIPMSFDNIFEEEKNGTKICVLSSSVTKIILQNKKNKVEFCPKCVLRDIACKSFSWDNSDYFVLTAKTQENLQYLFVANLNNIDCCIQKFCDDITFDLPKISTLNFCHDFYEHAIISKYELNPSGLKKLDCYSSRKEQTSFLTPTRKDTAKVFFECVKVRDYELARFLMTKQLSELLSDQHLKRFFPKFDKIKLAPERDVVLLVGEEKTYFQLSFVDGKIDNIEIFDR